MKFAFRLGMMKGSKKIISHEHSFCSSLDHIPQLSIGAKATATDLKKACLRSAYKDEAEVKRLLQFLSQGNGKTPIASEKLKELIHSQKVRVTVTQAWLKANPEAFTDLDLLAHVLPSFSMDVDPTLLTEHLTYENRLKLIEKNPLLIGYFKEDILRSSEGYREAFQKGMSDMLSQPGNHYSGYELFLTFSILVEWELKLEELKTWVFPFLKDFPEEMFRALNLIHKKDRFPEEFIESVFEHNPALYSLFTDEDKAKYADRYQAYVKNTLRPLDIEFPERLPIGYIPELIENRRNASKPDPRPLALFIYSKKDDEKALLNDRVQIKELIQKGYQVLYYEVGKKKDIPKKVLQDLGSNKIDLLVNAGHGSEDTWALGGEDPRFNKSANDLKVGVEDFQVFRQIARHLQPWAIVVYNSCLVGSGENEAINLANVSKHYFPAGVRVFSATRTTTGLALVFDKNNRVVDVTYLNLADNLPVKTYEPQGLPPALRWTYDPRHFSLGFNFGQYAGTQGLISYFEAHGVDNLRLGHSRVGFEFGYTLGYFAKHHPGLENGGYFKTSWVPKVYLPAPKRLVSLGIQGFGGAMVYGKKPTVGILYGAGLLLQWGKIYEQFSLGLMYEQLWAPKIPKQNFVGLQFGVQFAIPTH